MATINGHIEDYLTYYCSLKYPPEFAVLLKGSWGSGKTWFIKNFCENLKELNQKYLYVSLYGMTTFSEIEYAFFQQLHPVLSSKGMAITAKILKGALKATLKIDLDDDKKADVTVNSQIPDLNIPDYFKNTENCILIFDDLERCALSIENILGYINYFVEHQGLKVIIVANEDQIIKNEKVPPETDKSYKLIKEKLIGKTFAVVPDVDAALTDFISKVADQDARDFLQESALAVKEMYSVSKYENLRILKQTLWDFERLFIQLSADIRKKSDLIRHLLKLLMAFSFEIRHGKILASDIGKLSAEYFSRLLSKEKEKTALTEIVAKYDTLGLYDLLMTEKCWVDFLDKGIIDKNRIKESLLKSQYFQDENTPNWVKLWHYIELTDDVFESLLGKVESEFQEGEYKDIGVIKHVTGLLLLFSEIGIYKKDKSAILREAKESIDLLKNTKKLDVSAIKSFDPESYGGLGFAGKDVPEFKHLVDYVEDKVKEAKIESMPDAGLALLKIMESDVGKFYRMVCLCNSPDQIYYETPIFKYIIPNKFVESLLLMNPKDRKSVILALYKRYEFADINKSLIEELPWLEKVRDIMIEEQKMRIVKISGYLLRLTIEHYMNKIIKKLETANKTIATSAE